MSETRETWFDEPLIFTIAERHVRGRFVRLGPVLNRIMAAHSYPPVMEKLLAEALVREGETDAVLAYFELCRRFWEMDDGWLDRWSAAVREGAVPSFRANLEY